MFITFKFQIFLDKAFPYSPFSKGPGKNPTKAIPKKERKKQLEEKGEAPKAEEKKAEAPKEAPKAEEKKAEPSKEEEKK